LAGDSGFVALARELWLRSWQDLRLVVVPAMPFVKLLMLGERFAPPTEILSDKQKHEQHEHNQNVHQLSPIGSDLPRAGTPSAAPFGGHYGSTRPSPSKPGSKLPFMCREPRRNPGKRVRFGYRIRRYENALSRSKSLDLGGCPCGCSARTRGRCAGIDPPTTRGLAGRVAFPEARENRR